MKHYDFRFDAALIESFIGKTLIKYKHAEFIFTNSVTAILGFEINDDVYELTNEFEAMDFLDLDGETTVFRISKSKWDNIDSMINNNINEVNVDERINKILMVNDHTTIKTDKDVIYDIWDTKAIIFCFEKHEIYFVKEDCWFSQEIEIYKGHDLIEKIGDGKGILEAFEEYDRSEAFVERTIVEIK